MTAHASVGCYGSGHIVSLLMINLIANHTVSMSPLSDIVILNVGGRVFTTTRETLASEQDSLLAQMLDGRSLTAVRDANGVELESRIFESLFQRRMLKAP